MLEKADKDCVAAYHEAGHAVGAILLGVPIDRIVITGNGEGGVHPTIAPTKIGDAGLVWEHAIVARLGQETERLFFGRPDKGKLGDDAEAIARLYKTYLREMSRGEYRERLRERTAAIVRQPKFRAAVEALAAVLFVDREVSIDHAKRIVRPILDGA